MFHDSLPKLSNISKVLCKKCSLVARLKNQKYSLGKKNDQLGGLFFCRWQRETRIRSFTPKKIVGEVVYITPCGKKLRNYYEVEKVRNKGSAH